MTKGSGTDVCDIALNGGSSISWKLFDALLNALIHSVRIHSDNNFVLVNVIIGVMYYNVQVRYFRNTVLSLVLKRITLLYTKVVAGILLDS